MDNFSGLARYPALLIPPSSDSRLPYGFDAAAVIQHASSTGLWLPIAVTSHARRQWELVWRVGRSGRNTLRAFYDSVQGQARAFWLPSWLREFQLINPIAAGSYYVEVADSAFREADDGTARLYLQTHSGDRYTRLVTVSESYLGGERLRVDTAFAAGVEKKDVAVCCRLIRVRFASSLSGGPLPGPGGMYEYRVQVVEDMEAPDGATGAADVAYVWGRNCGVNIYTPQSVVVPGVNSVFSSYRSGGFFQTATGVLYGFGEKWTSLGIEAATPLPVGYGNVIRTSGGYDGTCLIRSDGALYVCGEAEVSGLGYASVPFVPLPLGESFVDVCMSPGTQRVLALDASGRVWHWGAYIGVPTPEIFCSGEFVRILSVLGNTTLALDAVGQVWAYGENSLGLLLSDEARYSEMSMVHEGPWSDIVFAYPCAAGLTPNGDVYSWGYNGKSGVYLGIDAPPDYTTPIPQHVGLPEPCVSLVAGSGYVLCLLQSGLCYGFGLNSNGQIGTGTNSTFSIPQQTIGTWRAISACGGTSLGIAKDTLL